jgi:hypothetical protein
LNALRTYVTTNTISCTYTYEQLPPNLIQRMFAKTYPGTRLTEPPYPSTMPTHHRQRGASLALQPAYSTCSRKPSSRAPGTKQTNIGGIHVSPLPTSPSRSLPNTAGSVQAQTQKTGTKDKSRTHGPTAAIPSAPHQPSTHCRGIPPMASRHAVRGLPQSPY